ncbi:MAG TPA: class I tRNA ligase family protein, partial [Rhodocyclaceae bacterium]
DAGVEGAHRFLKRLWKVAHTHVSGGIVAACRTSSGLDEGQKELRRKLHQTIAKVADDYGRRKQFNTAVAAVMELVNALERTALADTAGRALAQEALEAIALLIYPIAPHTGYALYAELRPGSDAGQQSFPQVDDSALVQDEIELVLQVNGKLRGNLRVAASAEREAIEALAKAHEQTVKFLEGRTPKKIVVVPGRLVNVVG